jgi:hypothetical protein
MEWPPGNPRKSLGLIALVAAIGAVVSLSGVTSWPDIMRGMRPPTSDEAFFYYVAQEFHEPDMCGKISWSAMDPGGFFYRASFDRSQCYLQMAIRMRSTRPCWRVRRLGAISLLDSQTSMWSCFRDAVHGTEGGRVVSYAQLVQCLNAMGYQPDSLQVEGVTPPIVSIADEYHALPAKPDVVERITRILDTADRSPAASRSDTVDNAYLAHIAALVTNAPAWCNRIPAGLPLATERGSFRSWCLFTLATNTKDTALCRRITIPPQDARDPRPSLQSTCLFQAKSPYPSNVRYAPEVPPDDRAPGIFAKLGYEIPRAADLPADRVGRAYDWFLHELRTRTDSVHVAARRRFIERAERLPSCSSTTPRTGRILT